MRQFCQVYQAAASVLHLLLLLLLLLAASSAEGQQLTVSIVGEVEAVHGNTSITGHQLNVSSSSAQHRVLRFDSIPYAESPTGPRRFAPPEPLRLPRNVNATLPAPSCPHGTRTNLTSPNSEDCLYLSVRTPDLSGSLPVLVLFSNPVVNASHGDALVATQSVVMATIASRQGVLGFLSLAGLADSVINIGLQDQRMALEFLRDTVSSFGGDSSRVTLAGHGTAAAAVGLHAVHPESKLLFHRVVMLGGSIASPLAWSESANMTQLQSSSFIERLGCSTAVNVLSCLRNATLDELLKAEAEISTAFVPVGDGQFFNFSRPDQLWRSGAFQGPLLIGVSANSGDSLAQSALGDRSWDSVDNNTFKSLVDQQFGFFPRFPSNSTHVGRSILGTILTDWPDSKFGSSVRPLISQAIGDFQVICPVWEAASDLVMSGRGPVFIYLLDVELPNDTREGHGIDALFQLGEPLVQPGFLEKHENLSRTMMSHLTSFVTHDSPSNQWLPVSLNGSEFMHYEARGNSSAADAMLGGFALEPGRCPLWKHEMPFFNDLKANSLDSNEESVKPSGVQSYSMMNCTEPPVIILSNHSIHVPGVGSFFGITIRTAAGVDMTQYLGIPYAKPPLGNLRFAKPEFPKFSNDDVHLTFDMKPMCTQPGSHGLPMSEDCLYLNIWTPIHAGQSESNLPVIVFIHGGFFQQGGVSDDCWRGSMMLDHRKVVFVSISYRLGAFGFLSLDETSVPGNFGLWDQDLAIQWVNRYIANFGGSRSKITLMGVESGAVAIGYHMMQSHQRFQRVIMLSGSPLMSYPLSDDTDRVRWVNNIFARVILNCETDTLACLQNLTESEINEKQGDFQQLYPGIEFPPVIDGDFIKWDPITAGVSNMREIPVIVGMVDSPGNFLVDRRNLGADFDHSAFLKAVEDMNFYFPRFPHELGAVGRNATRLHFTHYNSQSNPSRDAQTLADAIGNRHFTCANNRFLDAIAANRSVYSIKFAEDIGIRSLKGASLFDDAMVAIGFPATPSQPLGAARARLSMAMIGAIVSFADSGSPDWTVPWPQYRPEKRATLLLTAASLESPQLLSDVLNGQECGFWDHILPYVIDGSSIGPELTTTGMPDTTGSTDAPATGTAASTESQATSKATASSGTAGTPESTATPEVSSSTGASPSSTTLIDHTVSTAAPPSEAPSSTDSTGATPHPTTGGTEPTEESTTGHRTSIRTEATDIERSSTEAATATTNTPEPTETRSSSTVTATGSTVRVTQTAPGETTATTDSASSSATTDQVATPLPPHFIALAVVLPLVGVALIGVAVFFIVKAATKTAVGPVL